MGCKIGIKMKTFKLLQNILLVYLLLVSQIISQKSQAAFDVQSVGLFKDNTICIVMAGSTTPEGLNLANFIITTDNVQSKISSSGSLCPVPPFFTGGALLTTVNGIKTQADPTVQGLGRGILISELSGSSSGGSSLGDPSGFSSLVARLGGLTMTIFEITLPDGCDVIDDDDDIVGSSEDLLNINDFSFPTCASTNGLTVACNATSDLLTATTGLSPATSTSPAKIRFTISEFAGFADVNMIDSILIRLDSQDIFCPSNFGNSITATIVAKNTVDNPTITENIGIANIGTPVQAAKLSYAIETVTSTKGETSTNEIGTTPVLANGVTTANAIQIEELNNESIPIGGQTSVNIINPSISNSTTVSSINLWLIPSAISLFSGAPSAADITFSDNSFVSSSAPYIVMDVTDDQNAPLGTLVIPIKQNPEGINPATVKTTITIKNLTLSGNVTASTDSTISLAFFEPISGAIVNTPGTLSILNSNTSLINPQNFSSFTPLSTRGTTQNATVGNITNESAVVSQVKTDSDLNALTNRDKVLGTPQIAGFTKIVSSVIPIDTNKITVEASNGASLLTINASAGATIGGAKVKIDSLFDFVTVTSKSDGSFNAKLKADFSQGDVIVNLKQTVSKTDSQSITKTITSSSCEKTVCGCTNPNCMPNIASVLTFIQNNGGLSQIVTSGGTLLLEIISSAKKALGIS